MNESLSLESNGKLIDTEIEARLNSLETGLKENREILNAVKRRVDQVSQSLRSKAAFLDPTSGEEMCKTNSKEIAASFSEETVEHIYDELKFDNPDGGVWKQGWNVIVNESKFASEKLKVFVVPHSHNDPGWIKTFDQYFQTQTRHILNNMLKKLSENAKASFIWAEVSYFALWWETLKSEDQREMVKTLLDNGQLEFVNGGWVMNDEANTHYFAIISQMVEGHQWLKHNLDYKPRHGWSIDPFGMSSTMAFLLKRMGLTAMVVQRVHYSIKKYLAQRQLLEFDWKQFWEIKDTKQIICHIEPFFSYDIPHTCGPDPKVCCQFDFKRLPPNRLSCPWKAPPQVITDKNLKERAQLLVDQYKKKSMLFRSNSLLVPLGDDFRYDKLAEWDMQFKNYQKLFDYLNSHPEYNVEIKFGTLADYFNSLLSSIPPKNFASLVGDFFTYADRDDHYWSGYYTSRPFYKRFDRVLESYLRGTEIIYSLASIVNGGKSLLLENLSIPLTYARQNLALFQHHDAITGTAKDHVVKDYAGRMLQSIKNTQKVISELTSTLLHFPKHSFPVKFIDNYFNSESLPSKNVIKLTDENSKWSLIVYNSLAISRNELICVYIQSNKTYWIIRNSKGKLIEEVQINAVWNGEQQLHDIREACFFAHLKPLSLTQFFIETTEKAENKYDYSSHVLYNYGEQAKKPPSEIVISTNSLKLVFNGADGMLREVIRHQKGLFAKKNNVRIQFMTYGTRKAKESPKSGAYLFLPDSDEAQDVNYSKPKIRVTTGSLFSKIEVSILKPVSIYHQVTVIKDTDTFNIDNVVHLQKGSMDNQELIMRFFTDINNSNEFFTDLNGLQMVRRKYYDKIALQGNVYPMPTMMYFESYKTRMNILTAQPLGTTSRHPGFVDVFLDRRLMQDDQRGVNQGVTDNKPTRESFIILIEEKPAANEKASLKAQLESLKQLNPVNLMYSLKHNTQGEISFLRSPLPCDIHLLNLRSNLISYNEFSLFLHRFGTSCDTSCPKQQKFTIGSLFTSNVIDAIEPYASRVSLSLMHEIKSNVSVFEESASLEEMDFDVYNLKLK
ncbi:alpha-mannosidase 2-like protein [Dinothrombium tinctorium]|nr:alpha-mannosidase 2-like protein [Dinothrombium tinctorium]